MKHSLLYVLVLSFAVGIGIQSFVDLGAYFALFLIVLASVLVFVTSRDEYLFLVCALVFCALGVLRLDAVDVSSPAHQEQKVSLRGIVVEEPDVRDTTNRLIVAVDDTSILVIANRYPEFSYGDELLLEGILAQPKDFETDTGRVFHYQEWLAKDGIYFQMFRPDIEVLSHGNGNPIRAFLFKTKQHFLASIQRSIPDPEAALAGGLLVGAKQSLGEYWQDAFQKTGVIHIVVLSGFNVTVIAEAIRLFFRFLPLALNISVSATLIVLFALMTGGSATIVRATIMGLLVMLARATGRTYAIARALFFAGFLMLLWNPKILIHDPSFQLSFLATMGLIFFVPYVEGKLGWMPNVLHAREFAAATLGTLVFVLPYVAYLIGEVSLVAVPANILVLGAVPLAMLFGFLAGVAGMVSTLVVMPFAYVAWALLHYQLLVVDTLAAVPVASVHIPQFSFAFVVLAYALLGCWLVRIHRDMVSSKNI